MTFEIRRVDRATFDAMWTPEVKEQLNNIIYDTENWIDDVWDMYWVIDDAAQVSMLRVAMENKLDGAECYALVQDGEYALIRKVKYGTYAIAAISAGFSDCLDSVKMLAKKALLVGGAFMTGNPDPKCHESITKIPYVNFVEYVAHRIGD